MTEVGTVLGVPMGEESCRDQAGGPTASLTCAWRPGR